MWRRLVGTGVLGAPRERFFYHLQPRPRGASLRSCVPVSAVCLKTTRAVRSARATGTWFVGCPVGLGGKEGVLHGIPLGSHARQAGTLCCDGEDEEKVEEEVLGPGCAACDIPSAQGRGFERVWKGGEGRTRSLLAGKEITTCRCSTRQA